jgi:suppressor of tumorigenicity protein 13
LFTTGDQVIGIHSVSELQSHLDAASMRSRLAIVFFSKTRPCRFISPFYTSLAGKYPKVVFLKVDIAEATDVAAWWNIRKAPYFFFVKEGKVVDKVVGIDAIELKGKVAHHSRKQS